jgi:hypothetical protein
MAEAKQKKTVCVDLDATLATYDGWKGPHAIGAPRPGIQAFMADLRKDYWVVIHTTRAGHAPDREEEKDQIESRRVVLEWLDANNVEYDEVWAFPGKPMAVAYLDDRAVAIPKNPMAEDFAVARTRIDQLAVRSE